jgi:2-methylcitrate dehydratase PrpD
LRKRWPIIVFSFDNTDIDEETTAAAKRRILDSFVCSLAAVNSGERPIENVMKAVRGKPGQHEARIFGIRVKCGLKYASLANASTIRYLDWNDEYGSWNEASQSRSVGHPSGCIGALLSASDAFG